MPVLMMFMPSRPGQQQVDVARADRLDRRLARRKRIHASGRALQQVVHRAARQPALGARRVEVIDRRWTRFHDHLDLGALKRPRDLFSAQRAHRDAGRALQRPRRQRRAGPLDHADDDGLVAARAEGHAQRARQQDRKHEDPEERVGLAQELAQPRERELHQRWIGAAAITHRADACR